MASEEVLFLDMDTSKVCLQIPILDDEVVENPEDIPVLLSSPDIDIIIEMPSTTSVIILDNDRAVVGFEMVVYSVNESLGYIEVCAVITNGLLDIPVQILLLTKDGSAQSEHAWCMQL